MQSLYEMVANGHNGEAFQALSKQFGLNEDQTKQALEALMPAFSSGLKRNAADPAGFASFMQALSNGQHDKFITNPMQAFTDQGREEGNAILQHLFGSKEASRAIAANAEKLTGISDVLLKQMLPALAPMIMGGISSQLTGQNNQAAHFGGMGSNPLGQILEQMMGGSQGQARKNSGNPLEDILGKMMGGNQNTGKSGSGNPLEDILGQMMGGARKSASENSGGKIGRAHV